MTATMSIDTERLHKLRRRGGKLIAQCPACAQAGADRSGEHLVIFSDGRFGCISRVKDSAHRRHIFELVGTRTNSFSPRPAARPRVDAVRRDPQKLPELETPTISELANIAQRRGFPLFAGLELAVREGQLWTADVWDTGGYVRAWVVTDSSRRNAQARRMDGEKWRGIEAKAKTLPGSQASWPIGCADIGSKPTVALCEGGPDFLSAWFLAYWHGRHNEVAPVCMAGSGNRIPDDALNFFQDKHVTIFPHCDEAGAKALEVWREQLRPVVASFSVASVAPYKDLNEQIAACAISAGGEDEG